MEQNPRQSTRDIAKKIHITQSTVYRHFEKLGKVCKLGAWVPHNLSERNKEDRMPIATCLLSPVRRDLFFDRIITGDEKWIVYDNIIRKIQWLEKDQEPLTDPKVIIHGYTLCV